MKVNTLYQKLRNSQRRGEAAKTVNFMSKSFMVFTWHCNSGWSRVCVYVYTLVKHKMYVHSILIVPRAGNEAVSGKLSQEDRK